MLILIGFSFFVIGLGYVGWLMWKESKHEEKTENISQEPSIIVAKEPDISIPTQLKTSKQTQGVLEALEIPTMPEPEEELKQFKLLDLFKFKRKKKSDYKIPKLNLQQTGSKEGTASLRLDNIAPLVVQPEETKKDIHTQPPDTLTATLEPSKNIRPETNLSSQYTKLQTQYNELKEKYDKLNSLFEEKSSSLENTKNELANELEIRKEFNKVKDILEKELKSSKDKYRHLEIELSDAKTESDSYLKRINQLEEKFNKVDKQASDKDKEVGQAHSGIDKDYKKIAKLEEKINQDIHTIKDKDELIKSFVEKLETYNVPINSVVQPQEELLEAPPTEINTYKQEPPKTDDIKPEKGELNEASLEPKPIKEESPASPEALNAASPESQPIREESPASFGEETPAKITYPSESFKEKIPEPELIADNKDKTEDIIQAPTKVESDDITDNTGQLKLASEEYINMLKKPRTSTKGTLKKTLSKEEAATEEETPEKPASDADADSGPDNLSLAPDILADQATKPFKDEDGKEPPPSPENPLPEKEDGNQGNKGSIDDNNSKGES